MWTSKVGVGVHAIVDGCAQGGKRVEKVENFADVING
jgi:hypothetical protein